MNATRRLFLQQTGALSLLTGAGAPLALNLRRFLAGGELLPYRPQRRALNLLACGERYAIASWGAWSAEGAWVWRWKDRIDRDFMRAHGGLG